MFHVLMRNLHRFSVVILSLVFHSSFMQCYPLRFQLSSVKSVKYRFIEFFIFDYGSLPYVLFFSSIETNPMAIEEVCQHFNDLRSDLVLMYDLRTILLNYVFELQTLKHQYENLMPDKVSAYYVCPKSNLHLTDSLILVIKKQLNSLVSCDM